MRSRADELCTEDRPCQPLERCARCQAAEAFGPEDWAILEFYGRVSGQYINQTPFGAERVILTPRMEAWEAVLRIYDYDPADWPWLVRWGSVMFSLVHGYEEISWHRELGVPYSKVKPGDLRDGDPK